MVLEGTGRFVTYERSRSQVNVPQVVVKDSRFPLLSGEQVIVRIEGKRLVIERLPGKTKQKP